MFRELIINIQKLEKRIAVLHDGKLAELYTETNDSANIMDNIYKGIVRNVLPGLGAAFIDIGETRTALIHYSDLNFKFIDTNFSKKELSPDQINKVLFPGQEIIVQVKKGPIGSKGARLTGHIHIPGKYLVFMPKKRNIAISKKISSSKERQTLREIVKNIKDEKHGVIIRTDAKSISEEEIKNEYKTLSRIWAMIDKQFKYAKAPVCLYSENDISHTLIRDIFNAKIDRVVVDDKQFRDLMQSRLKIMNSDLVTKIELYSQSTPIFDAYGIEKEIEKIFLRKIALKSGGNITIDHTEALTAIDVNTGKFIGKDNYNETIKKTNLEAAEEIARQIKLRDISGIIIIDFIDMNNEEDQEEVLSFLKSHLKNDKGKSKIYPFTNLGLVEISRKHLRQNIISRYSFKCPHCNGRGRIFTPKSIIAKINRWLERAEFFIKDKKLDIYVNPFVSITSKEKKAFFPERINFEIKSDSSLHYEEFRVIISETGKDITDEYNS